MSDTPTRKTQSYPGEPRSLTAADISNAMPAVPTPPALDDQAKVAAVKSPTGTPRVKPKQINWLLAGTLGAVAGLELCAQQAPSPTVQLICRIGAVALGTFAGVASPGYRKR